MKQNEETFLVGGSIEYENLNSEHALPRERRTFNFENPTIQIVNFLFFQPNSEAFVQKIIKAWKSSSTKRGRSLHGGKIFFLMIE